VHATEVGGTHPALLEAMGYGNCVLTLATPENRGCRRCGHTLTRMSLIWLEKLQRVLRDGSLVQSIAIELRLSSTILIGIAWLTSMKGFCRDGREGNKASPDKLALESELQDERVLSPQIVLPLSLLKERCPAIN